ncbi:hypothetical protein GMSM_20980 [Geomonas sp. Red276]
MDPAGTGASVGPFFIGSVRGKLTGKLTQRHTALDESYPSPREMHSLRKEWHFPLGGYHTALDECYPSPAKWIP